MLNESQLRELIAKGEGRSADFKRQIDLKSAKGKAKFIKEVISLANSADEVGYLLVGVDDDQSIVGCSPLEEEQIQQIAHSYINPPVTLNCAMVIVSLPIPLWVGVIEVRAAKKPHKVSQTIEKVEKNTVFVRHGSVVLKASPEEIITLYNEPPKTLISKPSMPPPNPFGYLSPVQKSSRYVVREPLTTEIMNELGKAVNVSIVGDTHTGRTSFLLHICRAGAERLGRSAEDFVYLNLQGIQDEQDFFDELSHELGLSQTLRGRRLMRKFKGRQLVLCLDEAEALTAPNFTAHFLSELRALGSGINTSFTIVFTSRRPLQALFPDDPQQSSPLYNVFMKYELPPFTLKEARALVERRLAGTGLSIPDDEIALAWQRSFGHPGDLEKQLKEIFAKRYDAK